MDVWSTRPGVRRGLSPHVGKHRKSSCSSGRSRHRVRLLLFSASTHSHSPPLCSLPPPLASVTPNHHGRRELSSWSCCPSFPHRPNLAQSLASPTSWDPRAPCSSSEKSGATPSMLHALVLVAARGPSASIRDPSNQGRCRLLLLPNPRLAISTVGKPSAELRILLSSLSIPRKTTDVARE